MVDSLSLIYIKKKNIISIYLLFNLCCVKNNNDNDDNYNNNDGN